MSVLLIIEDRHKQELLSEENHFPPLNFPNACLKCWFTASEGCQLYSDTFIENYFLRNGNADYWKIQTQGR